MARSKSSSAWLKRHVNDPYVHRAKAHGYRSRAAYKLIEIAKRDKLARVGRAGRVIAVDLLEIIPIPGVTAICGDFREEAVLKRLEEALGGKKLDLVVSDMAPNLSGVGTTDQARSIHLCELALEFARVRLKPRGAFLVKVFQGAGYPEFLAAMRGAFIDVSSRKPGASRAGSSEMYLLGKGLKPALVPEPHLGLEWSKRVGGKKGN